MWTSAYKLLPYNDKELSIIVDRAAFDNLIQQNFMEKTKDGRDVMRC